jgi:hypothetical protein
LLLVLPRYVLRTLSSLPSPRFLDLESKTTWTTYRGQGKENTPVRTRQEDMSGRTRPGGEDELGNSKHFLLSSYAVFWRLNPRVLVLHVLSLQFLAISTDSLSPSTCFTSLLVSCSLFPLFPILANSTGSFFPIRLLL